MVGALRRLPARLVASARSLISREAVCGARLGENQDRLRAFGTNRDASNMDEGHQLLSMLSQIAGVGCLEMTKFR